VITAIRVLVWVVNPNLGEEEVIGGGVTNGSIQKSIGDFL